MKKFASFGLIPAIAAQSALGYAFAEQNNWVLSVTRGDGPTIAIAMVITTAACCFGFQKLFKNSEARPVFQGMWWVTVGMAALLATASLLGEPISLVVGVLGIWLWLIAMVTGIGIMFEAFDRVGARA